MTCPVCGNVIHNEDKFCGKCGISVAASAEQESRAPAKKIKGKYNLNGIIGFGLIIPFVIMVAINIIVFTICYDGVYFGGNPLIYLIGMIFPFICLTYSIVGMKQRKDCHRGNALTKAGLVINIVLASGLFITFVVLLCIALAAV
ncbi:MAG: hypothetical protein LUD50_06350 [Clostridia bacterium]|nr:hypothetical protein [Clostridia bacterium]